MSKFTVHFLEAVASGEKVIQERQARFEEEKKKKEKAQKVELKKRQNFVEDKYSQIIQQKLLFSASNGYYNTHFFMTRADFAGWHNCVAGGYKNAHPVDLAVGMMNHLQTIGIIPMCVNYQCIDENKFLFKLNWGSNH